MRLVQIDADTLAELRNLIYLDGRRALLIVAADSVLRQPQATAKEAPEAERPEKVQEPGTNQPGANK